MHPADITAALKKAGSSQKQVAQAAGVSTAAVWQIVTGRQRSWAVANVISAHTGLPVQKLWPGAYKHLPRERACERQPMRGVQ